MGGGGNPNAWGGGSPAYGAGGQGAYGGSGSYGGGNPIGNPLTPAGVMKSTDPVIQPNEEGYYAGKFFGGGLIPHGHGMYGTGQQNQSGGLEEALMHMFGGNA